jgi:hypothetical protein
MTKTQPSLFPVAKPAVMACVHGVPITWKAGECPQCAADPGDEPKGQ